MACQRPLLTTAETGVSPGSVNSSLLSFADDVGRIPNNAIKCLYMKFDTEGTRSRLLHYKLFQAVDKRAVVSKLMIGHCHSSVRNATTSPNSTQWPRAASFVARARPLKISTNKPRSKNCRSRTVPF